MYKVTPMGPGTDLDGVTLEPKLWPHPACGDNMLMGSGQE